MSSFARLAPLARTTLTRRAFTTSTLRMAGGDAGAPRSGGTAQGDAFTKREKANEDYYVKQQEAEKLKKRIADQEAQLAKDRSAYEELSKQGSK